MLLFQSYSLSGVMATWNLAMYMTNAACAMVKETHVRKYPGHSMVVKLKV